MNGATGDSGASCFIGVSSVGLPGEVTPLTDLDDDGPAPELMSAEHIECPYHLYQRLHRGSEAVGEVLPARRQRLNSGA